MVVVIETVVVVVVIDRCGSQFFGILLFLKFSSFEKIVSVCVCVCFFFFEGM